MAKNKEKKTKEEPYLLNDEENVEEVEKKTVSIYDPEKDKPEEILKAVKRADDDKVKFADDGKVSVEENKIIKVKDITKINLSESEIISILEETQNPVITKTELIETITNKLINEANMNDNVRRKFESGENDYKDILGQELTNQLAQESFREIADNIRQKTGKQNVSFMDVQRLLSQSLMDAAKQEYRIGTENLERKAVDMIRKQFNIPADAVDFDAKITGIPAKMLVGQDVGPEQEEQLSRQIGAKVGKVERPGLKMTKGTKPVPQGKNEEELKPSVKRRRLTNAMMHGAARKSQNLHHLDDEIRETNPQLSRDYANVMAANDANYFLADDDTIRREGESGVHAGNVRLDLSNPEKPKIIAQGIIFPILLHELAKGVVELMSLWSLPKDPEVSKYVLDKTDNLESETNDIRLGTKIWEKFVQQIPTENQEVVSLTWHMLQELPDSEFNSIIEGLIKGESEAQQSVRRLAEDALEELRNEASEEVLGGYDDSDEGDTDGDLAEPEGEEEEDDLLKSLLAKNEPEEVSYEDMSKRELEMEIDKALDAGDMELVKHLGSILNSK